MTPKSVVRASLKLAALVIGALFFLALLFGSSIQTHSLGIQKGCRQFNAGSTTITEARLRQYYGSKRAPDKITDLGEGRKELTYYTPLHGQNDSRHWSGYVIHLSVFPVLPLMIPYGHHGESYVVSNGIVRECVTMWHKQDGGPRFHI